MAKKKAVKAKPVAKAGDEYVPRLKERYSQDIVPKLRKEFDIENVQAVPRIAKSSSLKVWPILSMTGNACWTPIEIAAFSIVALP